MTATAETADYPIQNATARGHNPFSFFAAPVNTSVQSLPDGPQATFTTLAAMAALVRGECPAGVSSSELPDVSGYQNPGIKAVAEWLTAERDQFCESPISRCFRFVANQIKYVSHPINEQTVQDAKRTIQFKSGDCVSKSVLLATLLASLDYPVKYIAQHPNDETGFSHVYVLTQDESGNEVRLDPVASDKPMGWNQRLPDGGFETSWDIFRD